MKICNNCSHKNSDENNFCAKCGANLNENEPDTLVCKKCGAQNNEGDNFCINCGAELGTKKNSPNIHQRTKKNNSEQKKHIQKPVASYKGRKSGNFISAQKTKTVWIATSIIIGAVIIALSLNPTHKSQASQQSSVIENISNNPAVETEVRKIAEKFECSCGGCTKILFNCDCDTAITERNYIRSKIAQKKNGKQIIIALNNRYGHILSGGGFDKDLFKTN